MLKTKIKDHDRDTHKIKKTNQRYRFAQRLTRLRSHYQSAHEGQGQKIMSYDTGKELQKIMPSPSCIHNVLASSRVAMLGQRGKCECVCVEGKHKYPKVNLFLCYDLFLCFLLTFAY